MGKRAGQCPTRRSPSQCPASREVQKVVGLRNKNSFENRYSQALVFPTFGVGGSIKDVNDVILLVLWVSLHWTPKWEKISSWKQKHYWRTVEIFGTCGHDVVKKVLLLQLPKYMTCPEHKFAFQFLPLKSSDWRPGHWGWVSRKPDIVQPDFELLQQLLVGEGVPLTGELLAQFLFNNCHNWIVRRLILDPVCNYQPPLLDNRVSSKPFFGTWKSFVWIVMSL